MALTVKTTSQALFLSCRKPSHNEKALVKAQVFVLEDNAFAYPNPCIQDETQGGPGAPLKKAFWLATQNQPDMSLSKDAVDW